MLPVQHSNMAPVIPGAEQFNTDIFNSAFGGFGSAFRILKAKKLDFRISSAGGEVSLPDGQVVGVLLGVAPFDYCSWYAKQFVEGQEAKAPDLLWVRKTPDTFPDALPEQFRQKQIVGGVPRWDFRIARRTVWALVNTTDGTIDLENPVIFDMTSTSMYGKSDPRTNAYKWAGMKQFCEQYSNAATKVSPCMFLTQIRLDPSSPVQGVVIFRPQIDQQTGGPAWLDIETYKEVVRVASSSLVTDMLQVTEILDYDPVAGNGAAPAPVATPTHAPASAPAPAPTPATGARVQPSELFEPTAPTPETSLLADAQAVLNKAAQAAPAQSVSSAAQEGIVNIMGSLSDL